MLHFVTHYMTQKQTFENAQYGLEIVASSNLVPRVCPLLSLLA